MEIKMDNNLSAYTKYGSFSGNDSSFPPKKQSSGSLVNQIYLNERTIMADQFHVNDGSMATLMQILVFCNEITKGEKPALENSLLDFAAAKGFHKKLFDKIVPKIAEVRSDGEPRSGSAIIGLNGRFRLVTKDMPEKLLGRCDKFLFQGKAVPLTLNMVARVKSVVQQMTFNNLKVIMLAFIDFEKLPLQLNPVFQTDSLTLVGMIGLRDSV